MKKTNNTRRIVRHKRIRRSLQGTAERPRMVIFKTTKHIYAQLIDDMNSVTLTSASTLDKAIRSTVSHGGNIKAAETVGAEIAKKALEKNIKNVVFDRGGFKYHGCVKALADKAREAGLKF
jgi:large subunit ribosomal protein L18